MEAVLTTDLLSPNIIENPFTGTPKYLSVLCRSMICSVHFHVAMYLELNVAISTVDCNFEYQSIGVLLNK